MRTTMIAFLLSILLATFAGSVSADIPSGKFHDVERCTKVTGLSTIPDAIIVAYSRDTIPTLVVDGACLPNGTSGLYAVDRSYADSKGGYDKIDYNAYIETLEPASITVGPYAVGESTPLTSEELTYTVLGANNTGIVIYESKKVSRYNNGDADLVETYVNPTLTTN